MKMDKLKKDDIQLEKVVSELKERLKYKDELNLKIRWIRFCSMNF